MTKKCWKCRKDQVSQTAIDADGIDAVCDKCIERKHIYFMKHHAKKAGITSCVKNCACGFGK